MNTSLLKELRFTIGEQYELNEFNLKSLESTFINGLEYENYEYIKDDFKALFGIEFSSNVILQYNGDILLSVIYNFALNDLDYLIKQLNNYLPFRRKLEIAKLSLGQTINISITQQLRLKLDVNEPISLRVFKILGQT